MEEQEVLRTMLVQPVEAEELRQTLVLSQLENMSYEQLISFCKTNLLFFDGFERSMWVIAIPEEMSENRIDTTTGTSCGVKTEKGW